MPNRGKRDLRSDKDHQFYNNGLARVEAIKSLLGISMLPAADEEHLRLAAQSGWVPAHDADKLRAWLISKLPHVYDQIDGTSKGDLRILLDENMPYQMAVALRPYGYVSAVRLEGWEGKQDRFIYPYAHLKGHFDAIITKDKSQVRARQDPDLTIVALDKWQEILRGQRQDSSQVRWPVIVHMTSAHPHRDGTVETFAQKHERIADLIRSRSYAVIEVRPSGVFVKPYASLKTLWQAANDPQPDPALRPPPREVAQLVRFSRKVASRHNVYIADIMERVRGFATEAFEDLKERKSDPSFEDILEILDDVLNKVRPDEEADRLLVVEIAVRALRKLMTPRSLWEKFGISADPEEPNLRPPGLDSGLDRSSPVPS